ncbi:MAG: hypothetical protein KAQ62_29250 [Cyclobacteriaceae bacterium]|nr:hypothetical protein [Cyclobacteriaceae bacterium]
MKCQTTHIRVVIAKIANKIFGNIYFLKPENQRAVNRVNEVKSETIKITLPVNSCNYPLFFPRLLLSGFFPSSTIW